MFTFVYICFHIMTKIVNLVFYILQIRSEHLRTTFKNHIYKNMSLKTLKNLRTFTYIETRFRIKFKNISRIFEPQIGKKFRMLRLS